MAVDSSGYVYTTGYTYGNIAGHVGNYDAYLAKYDGTGSIVWTRQMGTTAADTSYGVALDGAGGVYITGDTKGSLNGTNAGNNDAILTKYSTAGQLQWSRQVGSSGYDYSYGVAAGTGGIYITGYTDGALPGNSSAGLYDAYVAKYDTSGNLTWVKQFGTATTERGFAVTSDGSGGVYVVGQTDGALSGNNAGDFDIFIARIGADGNQVWIRQTGSAAWDRALAVATDGAGGVYLTGETDGNLGGTNAGYADSILVKYDDAGNQIWATQIGTAGQDEGHGIAVAGPNCVYVTGMTMGDLWGQGNAGGADAFLVQYTPEPATLALMLIGAAGLLRRRR